MPKQNSLVRSTNYATFANQQYIDDSNLMEQHRRPNKSFDYSAFTFSYRISRRTSLNLENVYGTQKVTLKHRSRLQMINREYEYIK